MTLNPVDSSMIASVGYESESRLLRAVMKDGAVYDVQNVDVTAFAAFMASRSKGAFWHSNFRARAMATGGEIKLREPATSHFPPSNEAAKPEVTRTFEPDRCCGKPLQDVARAGKLGDSWDCPKCGTTWKPRIVGSVEHWEPHPAIMVF